MTRRFGQDMKSSVPDCIFCKIANREVKSQIVWASDRAIAFRDNDPQAPTHILIVPKKHIASLGEAYEADREVLGHLMLAAGEIARGEGIESGFRVVVNTGVPAGQSVFHLHLHLLGGRRMSWPPG